MNVREKLEWLAIVSNTLLWGGLGLAFLWLNITDPTLPEEKLTAAEGSTTPEATVEVAGNVAPRHRA